MPCDLCRKLSFCVYFLLTSAFRISGSLAYTHARRFFGFLPFFSFDYPACEETGWTISPCRMAFIISVPMIPVRFFHMISAHISLIQQGRFRRGGTLAISCAVCEALVLASRARCVRRLRPRCARDTTVRARFNRPPCDA